MHPAEAFKRPQRTLVGEHPPTQLHSPPQPLVFALFTAVVLGMQTIVCVALVFLFREMSAYVHHRALEVAKKRKADAATAVGWGDWTTTN